jgi:CheY-like chemotaxis protein
LICVPVFGNLTCSKSALNEETVRLEFEIHFQTIGLVAITGWGQAEDKDLSRAAGFDHHLVKPVDPDALLSLIQKRKAAHV